MLTVGDKFPAFKLQGVNSDNELVEVSVEENYEPLKKDWSVIYFYPKDFTFICPTEIAAMDKLVDEATVIGISGDNEFCKLAWKNDNSLIGGIKHSLAADTGLGLSNELGVVNVEEGVWLSSLHIDGANQPRQAPRTSAIPHLTFLLACLLVA